jgi:ABC-type dipeptide/oligopeptide/nickel transport system permease subunit
MAGSAAIAVLLFVTVFAGVLMPHPYARIFYGHAQELPSRAFLLGTDLNGRDTLSRLIMGARVSTAIGLSTAAIVTVVGVSVGAVAGFYGGWFDALLMRLVDVVYVVPTFLLAILLVAVLGRGLWQISVAIGIVRWPTLARLVRGQFLSLREREFVTAARLLGGGDGRLIWRHLLPNALTPIIVAVTFEIPTAIFTEAALSFAGIGVNPPLPSWGRMVGEYELYIQSDPWMAVPPALALGATMLGFIFLGDGLRDALDPHMRHGRGR